MYYQYTLNMCIFVRKAYFASWKIDVNLRCYVARSFIFRTFITREAYEDLNSTVLGFSDVVKHILNTYPGSRVIAANLNSDVIENMFSSQRGRCNGSNTNPTALAYSKSINTILMTSERQRSRKRNAATTSSVGNAYPYVILADKKLF